MKKWRYTGADPAELTEVYSVGPEDAAELRAIKVDLTPGEVFEAPDDWAPVPYPHPSFEEAVVDEIRVRKPEPEVNE